MSRIGQEPAFFNVPDSANRINAIIPKRTDFSAATAVNPNSSKVSDNAFEFDLLLYLCAPIIFGFFIEFLISMEMRSVFVENQEETAVLAANLGALLKPGDVLILNGPLAAGKTFFIQALARSLGSEDYISSPTYTIANIYTVHSGNLLHMDAYRLESIAEFRDLGLEEYFEEAITLIEWGNKVAEDFTDYLIVDISFLEGEDEQRQFSFTPVGERWEELLTQLEK